MAAGRLVAVLLLVANPAASHALARAAYKTGVPMWPGAVTDQVRAPAAGRGGETGAQGAEPAGQAGARRQETGAQGAEPAGQAGERGGDIGGHNEEPGR